MNAQNPPYGLAGSGVLTLDFDAPAARQTDPETSAAAAQQVNPSRGRLLALDALARFGPATDFELADLTGLQQTSIGKRRLECQRAGLVTDVMTYDAESDRLAPLTRPTPSGAQARVWGITVAGRAFLRAAQR
jgi:hypothetical protein